MTFEEIKKNKEINEFINKGNYNLGLLGYTDHSQIHCSIVADTAAMILKRFGYFEIFLGRMMMCRGAADMLGATFKLMANGSKVL